MASNRHITAFTIQISDRTVENLRREVGHIKDGVPRVINGAINKVLPKARTSIVKSLADILTVKSGNIRGRTDIIKSTVQTLTGKVKILGRRIGLLNFAHKEKRRKKGWGKKSSGTGVYAQAYKGGVWERFPHAFIAVGKRSAKTGQGNKHVFERASLGAGKRVARNPIWARRGLSLLDVYRERPQMHEVAQQRIDAELGKELDSQVNRFLQRRKAR